MDVGLCVGAGPRLCSAEKSSRIEGKAATDGTCLGVSPCKARSTSSGRTVLRFPAGAVFEQPWHAAHHGMSGAAMGAFCLMSFPGCLPRRPRN